MSEADTRSQFLVWAGEILFLVTWEPEPATPFGTMTIKVTDLEFTRAWAQEPTIHRFSKEAVEYEGLSDFADRFVSVMQDAHDVELRYEAEAAIAAE